MPAPPHSTSLPAPPHTATPTTAAAEIAICAPDAEIAICVPDANGRQEWVWCAHLCGGVSVREVAGKGYGAFATRAFAPGEVCPIPPVPCTLYPVPCTLYHSRAPGEVRLVL